MLITRILGVPGSLTRLEKSNDKKHGSVSAVRSHTKQCCAGDSWSGLMAHSVMITPSSWAGYSVASFGELHILLPQALEGAASPSKDLSPGPSGSQLEVVSFSISEGLCLTVPSSHSSLLVLHLDPVDIYLAVTPRILLPKVCRKRKCVLLHQAVRNPNLSLCQKQKKQTSKLNVRREQQLSDYEICSNSAENVSSCLFPF